MTTTHVTNKGVVVVGSDAAEVIEDLLGALKHLQTWPKQNCWCPLERANAEANGTKIHMPVCNAARAAIAKAEGK